MKFGNRKSFQKGNPGVALVAESKKKLEAFLRKHEKIATKKHENDIFFTEATLLTPQQMFVDESYQRSPKERMTMHKKILEEGFNLNRAEPLHVHVRKDKTAAILDGGGRWYIMKELLGMQTQVRCLNHPFISSIEEEAEVYLYLNTPNRMKVNQQQKFRAALMLKDKNAVEINEACERGGLTVLGTGKNKISIAAADTVNHFGTLDRVGRVKNTAWPKFKVDPWLYMAIGAVIKASPAIKDRRLVEVLIDNPPAVLHGLLRENIGFGHPHARNMPPKMAELIVKLYNFRLSAGRIEPNWERVDELCTEKPYTDRWGWYIKK